MNSLFPPVCGSTFFVDIRRTAGPNGTAIGRIGIGGAVEVAAIVAIIALAECDGCYVVSWADVVPPETPEKDQGSTHRTIVGRDIMGRPIGSVNREKPFNDALRIALRGDPLRLRRIAEKLAEKAEESDLAAIRELADRLDGRPVDLSKSSIVITQLLRNYPTHSFT